MNTNENKIITPGIVRWVLGIEDNGTGDDSIDYSDLEIVFERSGIVIRGNEYIEESLYPREGFIMWNDGGAWIDYCRFIYLAIEKCAAEGYGISTYSHHRLSNRWDILMRWDEKERWLTVGHILRREDNYDTLLHAQLAAIAWVYSKMQEGE